MTDVEHERQLGTPGLTLKRPQGVAQAEAIGTLPDAVIVHNSAHDEQRRAARGPFKQALRAFERRFLRSGRTRKSRLKGEMSVLLKAG